MSQTERVFDILYHLSRDGGGISVSDIAERYEVSPRQVKRDIEYVRYRVLPDPGMIEYSRRDNISRLSPEVTALSGWRETMIVSFSVMGALAGEAVGRDEIRKALPASMQRILSHVECKMPVRSHEDDERHLSPIFEAFDSSRSLLIRYRKDADGVAEERHVDPLKLVSYQGFWYLIGYDLGRKGVRTFRLSRAEAVIVADECSGSHDEAEVEKLIDSGYGIYLGSESSDTERYVMRFSHDAGRRVACELWHSGQQGRWVDGCYELSIPASSSVEIISKLLSFGPDGWPVAPERFVGDYWDAVRRMAERHPL